MISFISLLIDGAVIARMAIYLTTSLMRNEKSVNLMKNKTIRLMGTKRMLKIARKTEEPCQYNSFRMHIC